MIRTVCLAAAVPDAFAAHLVALGLAHRVGQYLRLTAEALGVPHENEPETVPPSAELLHAFRL